MCAAPLSSYGADQSGLVYGYVFAGDGTGTPIDTEAAVAWLSRQDEQQAEFMWLHFNGAQTFTQTWLQRHLEISDEFVDALKEGSRSTRIEHADRDLIAVVNDVVYDFRHDSSLKVATLWLSAGPRLVLSVRTQPLRSVDRLRGAVKAGERFPSPLSLVSHLLRDQADVLLQIMRNATDEVDQIEDQMLADRLPERAHLGVIRRDLVRLQRLLAPEPAALFRLLHRPPEWVSPEDAQDLRQSTEEFSVVLRDMAGLQERVKLLQEEIVARVSESTNRSVFVLTVVTVIALPINLTSGLFGMNVGGVPLNQDPEGFWIVVILVSIMTAIAAWVAFRGQNE